MVRLKVMEIDATKFLTELMFNACRDSLEDKKYGCREYHIESILVDNETNPWQFTLKYYKDESMRPAKIKRNINYIQTIEMLTRAIASRISVSDFAEFIDPPPQP